MTVPRLLKDFCTGFHRDCTNLHSYQWCVWAFCLPKCDGITSHVFFFLISFPWCLVILNICIYVLFVLCLLTFICVHTSGFVCKEGCLHVAVAGQLLLCGPQEFTSFHWVCQQVPLHVESSKQTHLYIFIDHLCFCCREMSIRLFLHF